MFTGKIEFLFQSYLNLLKLLLEKEAPLARIQNGQNTTEIVNSPKY